MVKNMYNRTCRECGCSFMGGPRAWFCPGCREERKREQKCKDNQRYKMGRTRKIGSIDICQNCGENYIVCGGLQKYCKKCASEMIAKIDQKQGLEYYTTNKEKINPVRRIERRKIATCGKCGQEIDATGGRRFCLNCENTAKKEMYAHVYVERGIYKRGNSYIVKCVFAGKSYFIKSTTDYSTAVKMRDYADNKSRKPDFLDWLEKYKIDGRPV